MAVGQAALSGAFDVPALNAVELRIEVRAVARSCEHARLLREVLTLHRLHLQAGMRLSTVPQIALLLQCSEMAAHDRLSEALLLLSLPGGIAALECGLLNVEQSAALSRAIGDLSLEVRLVVWRRLQARLLAALSDGRVLPAHQLKGVLAKWVIAADPQGAQDRRKAAEADGDVSYRRRPDGLGDLFATGLPAPLLQAVLCRVRDAARPWGAADERSAGKRRLDALVNLLLGRDTLPFGAPTAATEDDGEPSGRVCGSRCGCRLDAPAPCGAEVVVHVPLGAALGTTDELAHLVGHGPLDPEQLAQLLLASPRLRAVHVDEHGVPVSVDDAVHVPPRDDPDALREVLLKMAASPPGARQPQHPHDHEHPVASPSSFDSAMPAAAPPTVSASPVDAAPDRPSPHESPGHATPPSSPDATRLDPPHDDGVCTGHAHLPDTPGSYRPPRWLRRLVQFRAPTCEWPGCGVRAMFCDFEHDQAWPAGPTCPCNTGPLCRHHHRVKQEGLFTKTRGAHSAVTWTSLTGRSWTSPTQHEAPAPTVRALPATLPVEPHSLSPQELAELLAAPDLDPVQHELRTADADPEHPDHDLLADRLDHDTRWGLDLDDPYRWAA